MASVRLQIVDAVAAALATATSLTVHRNLDYAIADTTLPAIAVTSVEDEPQDDGSMNLLLQHCMLEIAVLVSRSANPEAAADPIEADIHAALYGSQSFGGHPAFFRRVAAAWQFDLGDSAQRLLRYDFTYKSALADLEQAQ